jgi:hypothetical protein
MCVLSFRAAALAALFATAPAVLAQQTPRASQEIAYLLDAVANSHCQFNRNGTWYDGDDARAHLQKKYDYLNKRNLAPTAEFFIERGGSRSSMSGKAYLIRCPGLAPIDSSAWLTDQLTRYRRTAK